jgi:uroporphyrinogen decarboxylase
MRQAGRYLPEYMELRAGHSFQEAVHDPAVAAEITLQPIRRFELDAAIIFSDIMTPLEAMGVTVEFAPGPQLAPMTIEQVARLPEFEPDKVDFVAEAIAKVRSELPAGVALIGFAGAPTTLLAYLLEGGGSKEFMALRSTLHRQPTVATEALLKVGRAMSAYLQMQVKAGADVVQLFDSWAGILSANDFVDLAVPPAMAALEYQTVPTIYFAPHGPHLLPHFDGVGATAYGVDWRLPLAEAWQRVGVSHPIQGNLDPAILLTDPERIRKAVAGVLEEAGGRPGHIFNLGHGIHRDTPLDNVAAMVASVRREDR